MSNFTWFPLRALYWLCENAEGRVLKGDHAKLDTSLGPRTFTGLFLDHKGYPIRRVVVVVVSRHFHIANVEIIFEDIVRCYRHVLYKFELSD